MSSAVQSCVIEKLRAAAFIESEGLVLLQRKVGESVWALPGGSIELGESPEQAISRELREELGETVACGELVRIVQNRFTYAGTQIAERGYYFEASLSADSPAIGKNSAFPGAEVANEIEFRWFSEGELAGLDFRPTVLKSCLLRNRGCVEELRQESGDEP